MQPFTLEHFQERCSFQPEEARRPVPVPAAEGKGLQDEAVFEIFARFPEIELAGLQFLRGSLKTSRIGGLSAGIFRSPACPARTLATEARPPRREPGCGRCRNSDCPIRDGREFVRAFRRSHERRLRFPRVVASSRHRRRSADTGRRDACPALRSRQRLGWPVLESATSPTPGFCVSMGPAPLRLEFRKLLSCRCQCGPGRSCHGPRPSVVGTWTGRVWDAPSPDRGCPAGVLRAGSRILRVAL